jgi:hypothetical protein
VTAVRRLCCERGSTLGHTVPAAEKGKRLRGDVPPGIEYLLGQGGHSFPTNMAFRTDR